MKFNKITKFLKKSGKQIIIRYLKLKCLKFICYTQIFGLLHVITTSTKLRASFSYWNL